MNEYKTLLKNTEGINHLEDQEFDFLLTRGKVQGHSKGSFVFRAGESAEDLIIVLSGKIRIFFSQNNETREVSTIQPGEITGRLPYSRMTHNTGSGQAITDVKTFHLNAEHFPEMIMEHHSLTEALVHVMSSRIRNFTAINMQQEKLLSLGKLSAGLAHELNNPASAMVRSSSTLIDHLKLIPGHFKDVMNMRVNPDQVEAISTWLFELVSNPHPAMTMMQKAALEDDLTDALEEAGSEEAIELAETLASFGVTLDSLEKVKEITGPQAFKTTLRWIGDNLLTDRVVNEINASALRIAELIKSIKEYSYMDRPKDRQKVDVGAGLESTLRMLAHKARANKVSIQTDFKPNLPEVEGFPGELNQVWTNLIDNALDAMSEQGGVLLIRTEYCEPHVNIHIIDNGPGIPDDVKSSVFDPFFTTKPIGKGTGLGLDIVSKIMGRHRGKVELKSKPGETEFIVSLPTIPKV